MSKLFEKKTYKKRDDAWVIMLRLPQEAREPLNKKSHESYLFPGQYIRQLVIEDLKKSKSI